MHVIVSNMLHYYACVKQILLVANVLWRQGEERPSRVFSLADQSDAAPMGRDSNRFMLLYGLK